MNTTESPSNFDSLDQMSTKELLAGINQEDASVHLAVQQVLPKIAQFVDGVATRMQQGGRLFYIGAGTSGRLGILDASEIPPTFGMPYDKVIGIMAGGDQAIRKAVEFAEDDTQQAWQDLQAYQPGPNDAIVGIAASGKTPYVIGGIEQARENGLLTACIVCNAGSALAQAAEHPIEVVTGPEFVTGSTRMKAGTAQKMVLNMISTSVMIKLGRVKGNKMVDMQLSNNKLVGRGIRMIVDELDVEPMMAEKLLKQHGSVRKVLDTYRHNA